MAFDMNMLASILGQAAQAVGTDQYGNQSLGAKLGAAGTQMSQANIMAAKQGQDRELMLKYLQGLTGEGVQTKSVEVQPGGKLKVVGELAGALGGGQPAEGEQQEQLPPVAASAQATAPPAPMNAPANLGGGDISQLPFFQALLSR